jgi:hypothetical protein
MLHDPAGVRQIAIVVYEPAVQRDEGGPREEAGRLAQTL